MEEDAAAAAASSSGSAAPNVGSGSSGGVNTTADGNRRNSIQQSRPDYLTNLLSGRALGRAPSLRLESSQDDTDIIDELQKTSSDDGGTTTTPRPSRAELSKRLTFMRNSIKQLQQNNNKTPVIENVEVKLHNYSYHVPIRIDAPSIKTVFNQSPCYVVTNFMVNVGELITGERKVSYMLYYC
jgi:hypothetical protein